MSWTIAIGIPASLVISACLLLIWFLRKEERRLNENNRNHK
jgi:hypothetical protein